MNREIPCDDTRSHEHIIVSQPRSHSPPNDHLISILEEEANQGSITQPDNPTLKYRKYKWAACVLCTAVSGTAMTGFLIATATSHVTNWAGPAVASTAGCTASLAGTCLKLAQQRTEKNSYKIPPISCVCSSITPALIAWPVMSAKNIALLAVGLCSVLFSVTCQACPYPYYFPKGEPILSSMTKCYGRIRDFSSDPQNRPDIQLPTNPDPDI